jgi:response regulator RpfG family c-di-GMP phosphodiesterase
MNESTNQTILLVDDESRVLSSFSRELFEMDICHVLTAPNAEVGLELVKTTPEISAIFSDYYMPGMDGVTFLAEVRKINPDITRVIITGAAGLEMAIDSVNIGQIFRFLIKPCPSEVFIQTVQDAIRQHQLITGERVLLNKTLNGAVKTLIDVLALFSPEVFAQTSRLRDLAHQMAPYMEKEPQWEIELAALLCQIGCVTVPREILDKHLHGETLNAAETGMIKDIPETGRLLLGNIPRLERISEAIFYQKTPFQKQTSITATSVQPKVPRVSYLLNMLLTYDQCLMKLNDPVQAFQAVQKDANLFDPELLQIFRDKILKLEDLIKSGKFKPISEEDQIPIPDLVIGSMLSRNVLDTDNRMVVARGTVISAVLRMRLINYALSKKIERNIWVHSNPPKNMG